MRDHTEIEELLALESLGGIEAADRARLAAAMAEHGPSCAECAEFQASFSDVAAGLGTDLAPTPVSAELEERTVRAALAERAPQRVATVTPSARRRSPFIAAAAAVVLLVVGAGAGYLVAPRGNELGAFVSRDDVQVVSFQPAEDATGSLAMAVAGDGSEAFVFGSLPAPPAGQVYEMWSIAGDAATSLGCMTPDDGEVRQHLQTDLSGADVAAVTLEPSDCPSAPTTTPILTAPLA